MFSGPVVRALVVALIGVASGCAERTGSAATTGAIVAIDDAGDSVHLAGPAQRVISLVPSATETLIALGATERIVGRTRYDVAPEVQGVPSVGGGIDPSVEAIVALKPDLVIGWDNDKRRTIRDNLAKLGIPVFSLRTEDTSDVFRGIGNLGRLVGRDSAAAALSMSIRATIDSVRYDVAGRPVRRVMFVVYPDPPMTAGPRTFVAQLIGVAGGASVFDDSKELWPRVSLEEVVKRAPELLILPQGELKDNAAESLRSRNGWRDLTAVKNGAIGVVSADLVQRPGANIGTAARALEAAIHPEVKAAK